MPVGGDPPRPLQGRQRPHPHRGRARPRGRQQGASQPRPAARAAARGRARAQHGLQVLESRESGHTSRGYTPRDQARDEAAPTGRRRWVASAPTAASSSGTVRACATTAAASEADFVRLLRFHGLRVKPRFAAGRADRVGGYAVALPPATSGKAPAWFSGRAPRPRSDVAAASARPRAGTTRRRQTPPPWPSGTRSGASKTRLARHSSPAATASSGSRPAASSARCANSCAPSDRRSRRVGAHRR